MADFGTPAAAQAAASRSRGFLGSRKIFLQLGTQLVDGKHVVTVCMQDQLLSTDDRRLFMPWTASEQTQP